MRKEQVLQTLDCRPGVPVPATLHWWGLYKFAHAGVLNGYEDSENGWSMFGKDLADVDARFYDDFAPATFHLSTGRRQGKYGRWFFDGCQCAWQRCPQCQCADGYCKRKL